MIRGPENFTTQVLSCAVEGIAEKELEKSAAALARRQLADAGLPTKFGAGQQRSRENKNKKRRRLAAADADKKKQVVVVGKNDDDGAAGEQEEEDFGALCGKFWAAVGADLSAAAEGIHVEKELEEIEEGKKKELRQCAMDCLASAGEKEALVRQIHRFVDANGSSGTLLITCSIKRRLVVCCVDIL
ncbi:MAG: hypothetical protein GY820_04720 [Gammaproteobacteria bacterium]|nr:hypothetical protein [Gammaproteobacteria bacterium]